MVNFSFKCSGRRLISVAVLGLLVLVALVYLHDESNAMSFLKGEENIKIASSNFSSHVWPTNTSLQKNWTIVAPKGNGALQPITDILTTTTSTTTTEAQTNNSTIENPQDVNEKQVERLSSPSLAVSCREMNESIPAMIAALHSDPEVQGLRPWEHGPYYFPGFDHALTTHSFSSRNIFFMGDSTLYFMKLWLQGAVAKDAATYKTAPNNTKESLFLANMSLREDAIPFVNPSGDRFLGYGKQSGISPPIRGLRITWVGFTGATPNTSCTQWPGYYNQMRIAKPQVVVANFGMHLLHMFTGGRNVASCVMEHWVYYEDWLQTVVNIAQKIDTVKVILFKTTNFMCASKFTGLYAEVIQKYEEDDDRAIQQQCLERARRSIQIGGHRRPLSTENATNYCANATFNEHGASSLNERLIRFVTQKQREPRHGLPHLMLYNDHDVESCNYTTVSDGRHYDALQLVRLRLLGNMLQCLLP